MESENKSAPGFTWNRARQVHASIKHRSSVRPRDVQQRETWHSSTTEKEPHVLGQPQPMVAITNSYHHHALGAGEGVLAKAREMKM